MGIAREQITGLILAGGQGSRMGHVDKGLQLFRGQAMVAHVITRLLPQVHTVAINANRNDQLYAAYGLPIWPDRTTEFAGPLAGLQSGLEHCPTDYLLAVPCDSPWLPTDLVSRLATALMQQEKDAAFAITPQHRHPVFCLLKKTVLPALNHFLQQDGRKMERWFASIASAAVSFENERAFSNINTLQELRTLESSDYLAQPDCE